MNDPDRPPSPQDRDLLRSRARELARPLGSRAPSEGALEVLEFRLAQERYALETRHVRGVIALGELTPIPCTPAFVVGVVNVRGRITTVIDIKKFFDLPDPGITDLHRIILVRSAVFALGLLADVVVGIEMLPGDSLQPTLPTLTGIRADFLKGVTADRLVVLDVDRLLLDPRIVVHEEVDLSQQQAMGAEK